MIRRRQFLAAGAWAGVSALLPGTVRAAVADGPRFVLRPEPTKAALLDDPAKPTPVWAYEDRVPGPVLRVRRGETFTVRLINKIPQPTSIHWHGIRIDNSMDGVSGLTQDPVPPGGTFDYTFSAPDAGTFWYHPHHRSWEQMARGLYGLLIVEEDEPPHVDRDLIWMADDWRLDGAGLIDERSFGSIGDWAHQGRLGNWLTVNGQSAPEIPVRAGERLRLRCANVANARILAFGFDREKLAASVVALDGQPVQPEPLDPHGFTLAPGQRVDLIVDVLGAPGSHIPVYEVSTRERIQAASFKVADGPRIRRRALAGSLRLEENPLPDEIPLTDAQEIPLLMEGGAMGALKEATYLGQTLDIRTLAAKGKVWSFNGIVGKPLQPIAHIPKGRTALINMINRTSWPHAMHLHGHHFRVVERNGIPVAGAPWRDTELIQRDEQVRIAFVADNPGKWLFHCHMLEHQAAGMLTWLEVV